MRADLIFLRRRRSHLKKSESTKPTLLELLELQRGVRWVQRSNSDLRFEISELGMGCEFTEGLSATERGLAIPLRTLPDPCIPLMWRGVGGAGREKEVEFGVRAEYAH